MDPLLRQSGTGETGGSGPCGFRFHAGQSPPERFRAGQAPQAGTADRYLWSQIRSAFSAISEHSHNYDLKQTAKRFYNEGIADAMIFRAPCGFFGTFLLPLCRELLRDISFLFREHELADAPYELTFRILQRWNHYRGYRRGESCRE